MEGRVAAEDPRLASSHRHSYPFILNTPEINLKTGRPNSTSKPKVGSIEMEFGEQWVLAAAERREPWLWRR